MRTEWILPWMCQMVTLLLTVFDVARKAEVRNTYKTFVVVSEVKERDEKFCRR